MAGLTVRYGARTALDGLDLEVRRGELFGLLGPNGSGKSTLLRTLATLLPASAGTAAVDGADLRQAAAYVRRRLGVVFQYPSLDDKLSVVENLRFQGYLYGLRGRVLRQRCEAVLERFALQPRRRDRVETLSGGLKRRLELGKALLHEPAVLLLDEPSTGLDPAARGAFWQTVADLRREDGLTIIVATHLMDEAEACDRVALLDEGRLVALDAPWALTRDLGGPVATLETAEPAALAERLRNERGLEASVHNGTVRLADTSPADAAALLGAYPEAVQAVRVGRPTLADVFLARTGHAFATDDSSTEPSE